MKNNTPEANAQSGLPNTAAPRKKPVLLLVAIAVAIILLSGSLIIFKDRKAPEQPVSSVATGAAPVKQDTLVKDDVPEPEVKDKAVSETKAVVHKAAFKPADYLTKTIKTRKNMVGQMVIEGTIRNLSTSIAFKDVVLDVSYLSKTGSTISTQRLVVYEIIKPRKKIPFKFKIKSPMGTKSSEVELVTATVSK